MLVKTRKSIVGFLISGSRGITPEVDEWKTWWKLKRQLHGRRNAAKKYNEVVGCRDGSSNVLSSRRDSSDQERR